MEFLSPSCIFARMEGKQTDIPKKKKNKKQKKVKKGKHVSRPE